MKSQFNHENLDIVGHTFDIIHKGKDTEDVIKQFSELKEVPTSLIRENVRIGIYNYTKKLRYWDISNISLTLDHIEKNNENLIHRRLIKELKHFVTGMKIVIWEPDFLPFNLIILTTVFSKKILDSKDSYAVLRMHLVPIIDYWRMDKGLIESNSEFFPMFFQIYYNSEPIESELIKIFNELENNSIKPDIDQYVKACNKLKKYFLLEHLDAYQNFISLLKIQDNFILLGNMGQFDSDIFNVFCLEPSQYTYDGTNPFLSVFLTEYFSKSFSLYLMSIIPILWSMANTNFLSRNLIKLNNLKTIHRKNYALSKDHLDSLLSIKYDLDFLVSDLGQVKKANKIFNDCCFNGFDINEKSIILDSKIKKLNKDMIQNMINFNYVSSMNKLFLEKSKEMELYINQMKDDLSFLESIINSSQQKITRKNNSELTWTMIGLTIVTAFSAAVVVVNIFTK